MSSLQDMQNYRDKLVSLKNKYLNSGVITPGSQEENQYIMAIDKVTKAIQFASISGVPNISGMWDEELPKEQSSTGIDWNNLFGKLIDTAGGVIKQNQPTGGGGGGYQYPMQTTSGGISTSTLLLVGAAGLGLYFILRKK
jgi:hypothetical protein